MDLRSGEPCVTEYETPWNRVTFLYPHPSYLLLPFSSNERVGVVEAERDSDLGKEYLRGPEYSN